MNGIVEGLRADAELYRPNNDIAETLKQITMAPLIGPVAVGKSTLIKRVIDTMDDFGRVVSFTTREKRPDEGHDQYQFYPHNDGTLERLAERVKQRQLVQYAVHPTTGYIYGSEIDTYSSPYLVADVLASAAAPLRELPFKSLVEVSLVCGPEDWITRFKARNIAKKDSQKRIAEAVSSLEWSLGQGPDMVWLDGSGDNVNATADQFVGLVTGTIDPDTAIRKTGEDLLRYIKLLQDH